MSENKKLEDFVDIPGKTDGGDPAAEWRKHVEIPGQPSYTPDDERRATVSGLLSELETSERRGGGQIALPLSEARSPLSTRRELDV